MSFEQRENGRLVCAEADRVGRTALGYGLKDKPAPEIDRSAGSTNASAFQNIGV